MSGTLYAIGVGPGDPDLLTLKAVRLIQSGALIAYPVGDDSDASFARTIAAVHLPKGAEEYGFRVPMRVARGPASEAYDNAARRLTTHLSAGRDVALLCEGDPFFYGSAMYLVERLAPSHPCEIVPGVTSLTACAAAIKRPLAARNERLKVLPAPLAADVLMRELREAEAAAIIKVGRHFEKIRAVLDETGLAGRAMIIERATGAEERITKLSDVPEGERPYFSTILVYRGAEPWGQS
ncbi:MAG: precorrin-2 C(20)-methyltransferase [Pseudomonadota bacterium]